VARAVALAQNAPRVPTVSSTREPIVNPFNPQPLLTTSATRVKKFRRCERKWWFEEVCKLPQPEFAAAQLGTQVHALLERKVRDNAPFPEDGSKAASVAVAGYDLLRRTLDPWPAEVHCEVGTDGLVLAGLPVTSRIDLVALGGPDPIHVLDYKTTSNFHYAHTEESARSDPQTIIYTTGALQLFFARYPCTSVRMTYLYINTRNAQTKVVSVLLSHAERVAELQNITRDVARQQFVATVHDVALVKGNLDACDDFRGCPQRPHCEDRGLIPLRIAKEPQVKSFFDDAKPAKETIRAAVQEDLTLYIGCLPTKGAVEQPQELNDFLSELAAQVCVEHKLADLSLADYGKGRGLFRAALRKAPPLTGTWLVRSGPYTEDGLTVLRPLAQHVIEALRS